MQCCWKDLARSAWWVENGVEMIDEGAPDSLHRCTKRGWHFFAAVRNDGWVRGEVWHWQADGLLGARVGRDATAGWIEWVGIECVAGGSEEILCCAFQKNWSREKYSNRHQQPFKDIQKMNNINYVTVNLTYNGCRVSISSLRDTEEQPSFINEDITYDNIWKVKF